MAPSDNRSDDALLARLNALKNSSVSLSTAPPGAEIQPDVLREVAGEALPPAASVDETKDPVVDLAMRFKRLHTPSPRSGSSGKVTPAVEDDGVDFGGEEKSLDVLLKELGGEEWDMKKGEEKDVGKLVKEVRNVLPAVEPPQILEQGTRKEKKDMGGFDDDAKEFKVGEIEPETEGPSLDEDALDDQEADDYIAQVLAELEIEQKYSEEDAGQQQEQAQPGPSNGDKKTPKPVGEEIGEQTTTSDTAKSDPAWSLPAAPRDLPKDESSHSTPDDEALTARLAALSGNPSFPSAPSFAPSKKPPIKTNKTQFTDEEIDSWCIICYDNATLRCLGCDGDLYCRKCWLEGHKGESAGYEERTHRAVEFVGGGGAKKESKVAIGAG